MLLLENNESMLKSNLFDLNGIKRLFAPSRCILLRVWTIIKTRARKYSVKACRKMCEAYKAYFGNRHACRGPRQVLGTSFHMIRERVTKHFPTSSVCKMGCASATMWPVYSRL